MKKAIISLSLLLVAGFYACKKSAPENAAPIASATPVLPEITERYYAVNTTSDLSKINEKATLGRVLFYDKHLSLNNAVSCASCHKQEYAFSDNVPLSRGFENRFTVRNSMAIQNLSSSFSSGVTFNIGLFWDGREANVKNLIMRPVTNHVEMGIDDVNALADKLAALSYYKKLFANAYGNEYVTPDRISESISLFIGAITANKTRFDITQIGRASFSALEAEGEMLFNTKYNCSRCHNIFPGGYNGLAMFDIGLDAVAKDKGRGELDGPAWDGMFKTPNLRNVGLTAPYMHDGRFATLRDVLDHYSRGINNSRNLAPELKDDNGEPMRMNISEHEKDALIAFLNTLTDYEMITAAKYADPFTIQ